jgi:hypothetical protein
VKKLAIMSLALCCIMAAAKPAPWHKWRSKIDNTLACSQYTLGPGWEWDSGPYQDSRCEKPVHAK